MKPLVSVLMGSAVDYEFMKGAVEILERFDVPYEEKILSAHRSPRELFRYAQEIEGRGIKVVIAGAGKAAHLPGVVASLVKVPVIGVPIPTKDLGGMDSLLSIVQMPTGVPVACVAIGNAKNAAILACEILSLSSPEISKKLEEFKKELEKQVGDKGKVV